MSDKMLTYQLVPPVVGPDVDEWSYVVEISCNENERTLLLNEIESQLRNVDDEFVFTHSEDLTDKRFVRHTWSARRKRPTPLTADVEDNARVRAKMVTALEHLRDMIEHLRAT
jgi:hypothetical protein